jgi:hypothetical protein
MSCLQLELFERSESEILKGEIREVEKSLGNIRRGMFSRHDELEKKYQEAREEIEKLKDAIFLMQETMRNYEAALFPTTMFAPQATQQSISMPMPKTINSLGNSLQLH